MGQFSVTIYGATGSALSDIKTFCGSFVSQRLSRSLIELCYDGAHLCLTMYRQIRALWKVLSQQAIAWRAIAKQSAERGRMRIKQEDVNIRR